MTKVEFSYGMTLRIKEDDVVTHVSLGGDYNGMDELLHYCKDHKFPKKTFGRFEELLGATIWQRVWVNGEGFRDNPIITFTAKDNGDYYSIETDNPIDINPWEENE